jgi:hypothetical protein
VERQQFKWVAYAGVLLIGSFLLVSLLEGREIVAPVQLAVDISFFVLGVLGVPTAVAVAVLRYRLSDIDRLINQTLVYGLLTALLGLGYAGVVLALGQRSGGVAGDPPSWAVAAATLAVAALFQPARRRVQRGVDRRFNRRRYDPDFREHLSTWPRATATVPTRPPGPGVAGSSGGGRRRSTGSC